MRASGSSATRRPTRAGAGGCTGCSAEQPSHDLRRASGHDPFLVPARSLEPARAVRAGEAPRHCRRSAIADRNSLAGIVRAYEAAKETGVRLVVGCRLDLADGTSLLVYPTDRAAYSRLCRLLSLGKGRAGKGKCGFFWDDVVPMERGPARRPPRRRGGRGACGRSEAPEGHFRRPRLYGPDPPLRAERARAALAGRGRPRGPPACRRVATGDVLYHHPEPAHAAGRGHLHPPQDHHRRGRLPPGAACRPLPEGPGRDGAPVRAPSGGGRAHRGDRRALPLLARRAGIPVPERDRWARARRRRRPWSG